MTATDWDSAPYLAFPQSDADLIKATVAQGHTLACATAAVCPTPEQVTSAPACMCGGGIETVVSTAAVPSVDGSVEVEPRHA